MSKKKMSYTLELDAEIGDLVSKVDKVKQSMQGLIDSGKAGNLTKNFASIEKAVEKMKERVGAPVESGAVFSNLQKDAAAIKVQLDNLGKAIGNISDLSKSEKIEFLPPELADQIRAAEAAIKTFTKSYDEAGKKSEELITKEKELKKVQADLNKVRDSEETKKRLVEQRQAVLDEAEVQKKAIEDKIKAIQKLQTTTAAYDRAKAEGMSANKSAKLTYEGQEYNLPKARADAKKVDKNITIDNSDAKIEELNKQLEEQSRIAKEANADIKKYSKSIEEIGVKASVTEDRLNTTTEEVNKLNEEFEKNKTKNVNDAFKKLRTEAEKLGVDLSDIPLEYTEQGLIDLNTKLNQVAADGLESFENGLKQSEASLQDAGDSIKQYNNTVGELEEKDAEMRASFNDNQAFLSRIQQFVGLQGGIEIARKAMQNAISTIKELDAAMTEMAVVTDLSVGDYWQQLPEHTARANQLGVAIKSVYEAETLYYQQGLKTNEVVEMSNETLKMARIAGLSAEDATNKMTAALRGFNMELNETSAQRISDVYSELAAITAADVDEISSAMTKTASIASSAGMEFETTAAFLSQIIETTRESAETAGTAMKTVIARFQELKKDPAEIGEIDGEIVDANKIETALRSVGVSLRDANGQFRELDDVFLELSSKWDSLDTNTQRYIATIAAGSRQQSRFIAMMSDYSRTSELVEAANNSAGASNEQFEKTMDSLDAKLNKLKNAWDTFTMSLMDSEIIKMGVDLLTMLMDTINGVIALFDKVGLGGPAAIGLVIAALYLGDKALKVFMGSFQKTGSVFKSFGAVGSAAIKGINVNLGQAAMNAAKLNKILSQGFSKQQTASIDKYNKYLKQEQDLAKRRIITQGQLNDLEIQGKKNTAEYNQLKQKSQKQEDLAAGATARRTAAQTALFASMELTEAQQKEALALSASGIAMDQAAILASAGYSAAQIAEMAAAKGVTQAEMAESLVKDANTKKTGLAAVASFILASAHTLQKEGLKGLIKSWWSQLTAKIADITATWGQVAANTALQISMWPILVIGLLIVAAFIALVAIALVIVAVFKAIKNSTPEAKLESAEKASEAAADAADKAAESYNNLVDSLESLDDKYDSLDELTRGTKEWEKAVREVNEEVMGLIDKYPELAGLVENDGGVLRLDIESDEVQKVLNQYEMESAKATAASYAAKINVNEKKTAIRATEVAGETQTLVGHGDSASLTKLSENTTKKLAEALSSPEMIEAMGQKGETQAITEWLKANGGSGEQYYASEFSATIVDNIDSLKEFGAELNAMSEQERVYNEAIANAALGAVDLTKYTEDQQKQMENVSSADMAKRYTEQAEKDFDAASKDEKNAAKEEVAKNLYGDKAKVEGNKIIYTDESGEKQEVEMTDEEFKEQYAAMEATEKMTAAFELVPNIIAKTTNAFEKLNKGLGSVYKKLVTDPENLTKGEAGKIDVNSADFKQTAAQQYASLSEAEQEVYGSYEAFLDSFSKPLNEANAKFTAAQETLTAFGKTGDTLNDSFTSGAAESYAQVIQKLSSGLNDNGQTISDLNTQLNEVAKQLTPEQLTTFMREFNAIDLKDINAYEQLETTLEELGMGTLVTSASFQTLISDAQAAASAIDKIDLDKLISSFTDLQNIVSDIDSGEQGRTFDEDTYKKLIESNKDLASKFVFNNEGYVYLGSSMAELTAAVNENTESKRKEGIKQQEDLLTANEIIQQLKGMTFENGTVADIGNMDAADGATQRNYIASLVTSMTNSGADVNSLGITGLTKNTSIETLNKMSDLDIQKIIDAIQALPDEGTVKNDLDTLTKDLATSASFNYSEAQNAAVLGATIRGGSGQTDEERLAAIQTKSSVLMAQASEAGVSEEALSKYSEFRAQIDEIMAGSGTTAEKLTEIANLKIDGVGFDQASLDLAEMAEEARALSEEAEKWKTEFGFLDQLNRSITQEQREREKLEREYTRLLEEEGLSQEAILNLTLKQMESLRDEADLLIQQRAEAQSALAAMASGNEGFAQYVNFDASTGAVSVDYDAAQNVFGDNSEMGEAFDAYVSELYDLQGTVEDAEDSLAEIEDQTKELTSRGEDDYSALWNEIRETIGDNYQSQIDKLSEVNDSIQEAQNALVNQIQKQIDEERQARENEKTEQNIADKQSQLAYLLADTSGAGALEAASLQQEIETDQEAYGDSLVDQALANIQDANAQAAEQRQMQIDIAQAQLDAYMNSQESYLQAQEVLNYALSNQGALGTGFSGLMGANGIMSTTLTELLTSNKNVNAIELQQLQQEKVGQMQNATVYAAMNGQLQANSNANTQNLAEVGSKIESTSRNVTDKIETETSKIMTGDETSALYTSYDDKFDSLQAAQDAQIKFEKMRALDNLMQEDATISEEAFEAMGGENTFGVKFNDYQKQHQAKINKRKETAAQEREALATAVSGGVANAINSNKDEEEPAIKQLGVATPTGEGWELINLNDIENGNNDSGKVSFPGMGDYGFKIAGGSGDANVGQMAADAGVKNRQFFSYKNELYYYSNEHGQKAYSLYADGDKTKLKEMFKNHYNAAFETGGLADFTGPAWLDGTKSHPELVLNARDTQNFIQLKDILAEIMNGANSIDKSKTNSNNTNSFDIDINVESLSDDYDVEQLADKIRSMLYDDASYRNINAINLTR